MDLRTVLTLLAALALAWAAYGGLLWVMQEKLVFPAPTGVSRAALDAAGRRWGAEPVTLAASDGVRLYAWHRRAAGRRLVIYFGGNAETVADNVPLHLLLVANGCDVLSVAYRGYPGSEGSPTEAGLVLDALAAWEWAVGPGGFRPADIVLHGRSLGGGVAAHLAEQRTPAGLVLESTFASVRRLARRQARLYPVDLLLRNPFDTDRRAGRIGAPAFVVHSFDDEVIPIGLAATRVADRFREAEVHEAAGYGHARSIVVDHAPVRERYLAFLARVYGGSSQ